MDNRGRLPPGRCREPKPHTSAIQLEHGRMARQIRREPGDPVTSTHVRKEDPSDVPRKVPRFQYVDFPSLHQCIKQLSVPPLDGWLSSCPIGRVQTCPPSSPKEKVPKFKYVDYPSLYHCIQQLSVPPLEIWSSGLTRPGSGDSRGAMERQSPSEVPANSMANHQELQGYTSEQQTEGFKSPSSRVPIPDLAVLEHPRDQRSSLISEKGQNPCTEADDLVQKTSGSTLETGSRSESDRVAARNKREIRPSVISMVRTDWQKHRPETEERMRQRKLPEPVVQVKQKTILESVCPFCQQMFADPEELRIHQHSHKNKRPH